MTVILPMGDIDHHNAPALEAMTHDTHDIRAHYTINGMAIGLTLSGDNLLEMADDMVEYWHEVGESNHDFEVARTTFDTPAGFDASIYITGTVIGDDLDDDGAHFGKTQPVSVLITAKRRV